MARLRDFARVGYLLMNRGHPTGRASCPHHGSTKWLNCAAISSSRQSHPIVVYTSGFRRPRTAARSFGERTGRSFVDPIARAVNRAYRQQPECIFRRRPSLVRFARRDHEALESFTVATDSSHQALQYHISREGMPYGRAAQNDEPLAKRSAAAKRSCRRAGRRCR